MLPKNKHNLKHLYKIGHENKQNFASKSTIIKRSIRACLFFFKQ